MADFTPINTQEEFDAAIAARLERERARFSDYETLKGNNATLQQQIEQMTESEKSYKSQIGELNKKIKAYESDSVKTRIAIETGLPLEIRERLTGETEDEIRKDAEMLVKLFGTQKKSQPLKGTEGEGNGSDSPWRDLSQRLGQRS